MKKLLFPIIIFLLLTPIYLNAQIGSFYTSESELSSSLINAIYQDQRNYIWIATEDGLNKYDGIRFTIYKNIPDNPKSIKNNYIKSLFEDSKGRFWIGSINGLHLYNRTTDDFSEIILYNNGIQINTHITSIIESNEGEIWLTTSGEGIVRIKENDKSYSTYSQLSNRLSSLHLSSMFQDSKGIFWIASENQGLNRYNPKTDEVLIFREPFQIGSNQLSAICEDNAGNLFVGTLNNGLYRYNEKAEKFELVPHIKDEILSVKSLLVDNQNRLLVGTDGQGIKIYNPEKNHLEDNQLLSAPFDFSKLKVHAICQDKTGNIWMGLFQKGVYLDPENPNKFNYWGMKSYNHNIIGSGSVMSVLKDKNGNLWVGTDNDGIYCLNKSGVSRHFSPSSAPSSVPNTVLSIIEDNEEGYLWLGSYLQGLSRMDKTTGKCTYFNNHLAIQTDDNSARDKIFSIVKDNRDQLWIGTNGSGMYVFNMKTQEYTAHYSQWDTGTSYIINDWVNCITIDREGIIWIGTYNRACSFDPDNYDLKEYTTENNILPGKIVYCITEDSKGNIWIGTTEGLACYHKEDNTSDIYTISNGLSSNVICGILEDETGNLWISTHSGISKFIPEEKKFINFYTSDGLQGNEFNLGACYEAKDGEMIFGGISGITSFYPSQINDRRTPLNIYLTGLYIFDKPVVAEQKSGKHKIIDGFIADTDTIRLSHNDNMFAVEFSTFDFGFSERIHYQYMMEGLSNQWLKTEPGINRINFTNISHGTYKLKIKASIYENTSEEKNIILIISPPWYLTWWAIIGYLLIIALLIWGVSQYLMEKIHHKNELMEREHAEQISEAKLQFFINIAHEIRTPMSLVISPLEKLIAENKDAGKQKDYLLIYRNSQRILRLINQLMDVRKIDKGLMRVKLRETDIVGFIEDVMQTFEYSAHKQNIKFIFLHTADQLKVWIDLNNFDKVLVNLLSNAFKFTPAEGKITITLQTGENKQESGPLQNYFEIIISDTGPGIEEGEMEKIFERFYQIDNSGPSRSTGTGIGLNLSRSLVELQHGTIYARNRKDCQGSEFIIRLPLGSEHLEEFEKESLVSHPTISVNEHKTFDTVENNEKPIVRAKTKYRILIVDDEEDIRQYLNEELSDTYRIYEAGDGKEALNFILNNKPDLVISDVMMPEMDGIALAKKLKSNININQIPIILLTAKASEKDKAEGFETGADAYISKPFNLDLLKKQVANILENRERLKQKASDLDENKALIEQVVLRPSDQILYEKIIKTINENISNPDLNVEFLAQAIGMSRVHMHRKLKELTNQSARDFIRSIRLNQAAELLTSQKLTVSEVAYALGYSNLSHFSNSFREFLGMSPKEYAEKHWKEN